MTASNVHKGENLSCSLSGNPFWRPPLSTHIIITTITNVRMYTLIATTITHLC